MTDPQEQEAPSEAERVFEGYLERISAGEQVDFDALCALHPDIEGTLRHMRALLAVTEVTSNNADDEVTHDYIGPYRLLHVLGQGGMGTVYLAEQTAPLKRRVALKLIKLGMDSKAIVQRFEQERQALALMDHEGIARVLDCGTSERGQPYFVMELVKGIPLDTYCEQRRLTIEQRLQLVRQVCAAVQHAHHKGVIHRDLKPANVLVSDAEHEPRIKIIDFGLAKASGNKLVQDSLFTDAGTIVGTHEYMAPEQADPSGLDVDTRADVYSIGVILYQLLVGSLPFTREELLANSDYERRRILLEVEAPRPSTRLVKDTGSSTTAARRRTTVSPLRRALRSDLDWVALKALEKDRNRRYGTATALADDLQRFLTHEPVLAGPPTTIYRLKKMLRRNRGPAIGAALVLLTMLGGSVATFVQWRRAEQKALDNLQLAEQNAHLAASETLARQQQQQATKLAEAAAEQARDNAAAAEAAAELLRDALVSSDPNRGGDQRFLVVDAMEQAVDQLDRRRDELSEDVRSKLLYTIGRIFLGNSRPQDALNVAEEALTIERALESGDDKELASKLNLVARCLNRLDRGEEALLYFQESLAIKRRTLAKDERDLASGCFNLAFCLTDLGRTREALPLYEEAIAISRRGAGPGAATDTATFISGYASALKRLNRHAEANELYQESLDITRRLFPQGNVDVARSLNNVAQARSEAGDEETALELYEEALRILERLFPDGHERVASLTANVGHSLLSLKRGAEAMQRFDQALAMLERLYPDGNAEVAHAHSNRAQGLMTMRRFDEAVAAYERALAWEGPLDHESRTRIAQDVNNLGYCLLMSDRNQEALARFQQSLKLRREQTPGDHPSVLRSLGNVTFCLVRMGALETALPYAIEADAMARRTLPEGHPIRRGHVDALAKIRETMKAGK